MEKPKTKRELDILEIRGYWQASSYLRKIVKRLIKKRAPLEIRHIKEAHRIMFMIARQSEMAGKYRKDNPEVKKIDGGLLGIVHWYDIPNAMSELDAELRELTKGLHEPKNRNEFEKIIYIAARLSHRLACIHPFENGNGRSSRLLIDAILMKVNLPQIAIKYQKSRYLRAMCQADNGDFTLLENLILRGLIEAWQLHVKQFNRAQRAHQ